MTRRAITTAEAHERATGQLVLYGIILPLLLIAAVIVADLRGWLPLF